MPSRRVQFSTGAFYHIFNRGAARSTIYRVDEDYIEFIRRLKCNVERYRMRVIAYCLIPNHFHLLLRQDGDVSAGKMIQYTCNGYAQWFNRHYHRVGTLFQGRFQAKHVDRDDYLRHLCRYIHGNPVRHGVALQPHLWRYSNYLDWIGQRCGRLIDDQFILDHFGSVDLYRRSLMDYLTHSPDVPEKLQAYLESIEE